MEGIDKSQKSGFARWLPFIIPGVVIVLLLPVALYIGFSNDEGRNESTDPVTTPEAEEQTTPVAGAIEVTNFAFVPNELNVASGATLTFDNTSASEHRLKIGDAEPEVLQSGDKWEWQAEEAGTFDLVCTLHPNEMTGEITVE